MYHSYITEIKIKIIQSFAKQIELYKVCIRDYTRKLKKEK